MRYFRRFGSWKQQVSWMNLCAFVWEVVELVRSTDQHCCVEFPGTVRILKWAERVQVNNQYRCKEMKLQPDQGIWIHLCSCVSHLYGVCTGGNIADNKPTAPPLGCVRFTGMEKEAIMDLGETFWIHQSVFIALKACHLVHTKKKQLTDICPANRGQNTASSVCTSSSGISWLTDSMFPGRTARRWGSMPEQWLPTGAGRR